MRSGRIAGALGRLCTSAESTNARCYVVSIRKGLMPAIVLMAAIVVFLAVLLLAGVGRDE